MANKMYMLIVSTVVWGASIAILCGCVTRDCKDISDSGPEISNNSIVWSGDFTGISVEVVGEYEKEILASDEDQTDELLDALSCPDQWIAAHVILTERSLDAFPVSASEWNGLRVLLTGKYVFIDKKQQDIIRDFWMTKLKKRGSVGGECKSTDKILTGD